MLFIKNFLTMIMSKFRHKPQSPQEIILTLEQQIQKINDSYHFLDYDDNLIDEIFTVLSPYCTVSEIQNLSMSGTKNWQIKINEDYYFITERGIEKCQIL